MIDSLNNYYFQSLNEFNLECKNVNSLNIFSLNARSMQSQDKFNSLKNVISNISEEIHLIIIQETWIPNEIKSMYEIDGYKSFHCCREEGYGGVSVYVHQNTKCSLIGIENFENINVVELILNEYKIENKPISVVAYYRPPSSNINVFLKFIENKAVVNNNPQLFLGDSNIDTLSDVGISSAFKNLLSSYDYVVCNNMTTRPASLTCIDHVISNFLNAASMNISSICNDLSDHNIIFTQLKTTTRSNKFIMKSTFKTDFRRVINGLPEIINSIDWSSNNPDLIYSEVSLRLTNLIKINTKETCKKIKHKYLTSPWITDNMKTLITQKHVLKKRLNKDKNNVYLKDSFRRINRLLEECLHEAKDRHYKQSLAKCGNDPKKTWAFLNKSIGRSRLTSIPNVKDSDGNSIECPKKTATLFNNHFIKVSQELEAAFPAGHQCGSLDTIKSIDTQLHFDDATQDEIVQIIESLDSKSAPGHDLITVQLLKDCKNVMVPFLTKLFNLMLSTSRYPDQLKIQKVTPIFKSGDPALVENYRPISVLSVINKVIEKLLYSRILKHLENQNFFYKSQYGFRKKSNTAVAIQDLIQHISEKVDGKMKVGGLFLDLKKAFDSVNHEILIYKLEHYGIQGSENALIKDYLMNRRQYVQLLNNPSSLESINVGVPQGSVLGPLFYLIFINDFARLSLSGQLFLFADDSSLFYHGKSEMEIKMKIENDLPLIAEFMKINKLHINTSKTKLLKFWTVRTPMDLQIEFGGATITESESVKFLGVVLSKDLKWKKHIEYVRKKVSPALGILFKFKHKFSTEIKKSLYFALIHSHLTYNICVWGFGPGLSNCQVLQNRALKCVFNLNPRLPTVLLYTSVTEVLPLQGLFDLQVACSVFKRIKGFSFGNIRFIMFNELSDRSRRKQNQLILPLPRVDLTRQQLKYQGAMIVNDLPDDILTSNTVSMFKSQAIRFIKERKLALYL